MINLLPPKALSRLRREQRLRFASVFMLMLAAAFLVFFALSLPTWLMQRHQVGSAAADPDLMARIEEGRQEREREARAVSTLVEHFSQKHSERGHFEIIRKLDELAGPDIQLRQFSFDAKNKMSLSGIAKTRAALSEFREIVTADKQFSAVELPLASLVNERDAAFTITATIK